jgi:DNA-binding CsgD family transcriptional regulator/sugar-specific transcriptional regulator TrmB
LSADAVRLYGTITRQEPITEANKAHLEELVAWGVVGFDPERPHVPVALDPKAAARRRFTTELAEAALRVQRMSEIPALTDTLLVDFERAQWHAGGGSEFLDDPATVNARLEDVVGRAEKEILSAQPGGPRTRELLELCVDRDTAALARGVSLRTLYRDKVRDDQVTSEYARVMSARGTAYRTLVSPYERCIVVDRRQAFISDHVVEGAPPHAAWHVTDRAMVAYIAAVYDEAWRRASPWHGELRTRHSLEAVDTLSGPDSGVRTTRRQREILRDMAAGTPQTATARRLGISPRTLTDQITALKGLFGAQTLHELTYQFALSPDHRVDDGPAEAVEESAA